MMRLFIRGLTAAAFAAGSVAVAHPTDVAHPNRGACEAAFAASSKLDREHLVDELGVFDNYGQAQPGFRDIFRCEYNDEADAWYIVVVE